MITTDSIKLGREFKDTFFLNEERLKKIINIIKEYCPDCCLLIDVTKKDSSTYKTSDINVLFQDENIVGKEIVTLEIKVYPNKEFTYESLCVIIFNKTPQYYHKKTIEYTINIPDKGKSYSLREDLDTSIKRILKGKNSITKTICLWFDNLTPVLIYFLIVLLGLKYFPNLDLSLCELKLSNVLIGLPIIIFILAILFSLFSELSPFENLHKYTHPSVFYWGDQKEIYDKHKRLMNNILWGIIIASIISVITGIIATKIS